MARATAVAGKPCAGEATPSSPRVRWRLRFTPEQFHQLAQAGILDNNRRYELIEGDIIATPPEGAKHAGAKSVALETLFGRRGLGWHRRVESPLRLGESEPIPDIAIVPGRPNDYRTQHPTTALLIVEIADSSLEYDRLDKRALYAQHGIPEYWIVNLQERVLEVYRDPVEGDYQTVLQYTPDETVCPLFDPEWQIAVGALFGVIS